MEEDGRGGAEARCWKGETAEAPESNFVIQSDLHLGRTTSSLSIFIAVERSTNFEMYLGNHYTCSHGGKIAQTSVQIKLTMHNNTAVIHNFRVASLSPSFLPSLLVTPVVSALSLAGNHPPQTLFWPMRRQCLGGFHWIPVEI